MIERVFWSLQSYLARLLVGAVLSGTLLIAALGRFRRRRPLSSPRRLLITGTFYNEAWFLAHARPLARSGFDEVIVVADAPCAVPAGVRFSCPPDWLSRGLGRALAKLLWVVGTGLRQKPALYMGYHLLPGAVTALIASRLLGGAACYQQTGGSTEINGGGYATENAVLSRLGYPSARLERLALAVVRQFDLVVVRGSKAQRFLAERGIDRQVAIVTGSVDVPAPIPGCARPFDLVFVGRLVPRKQPVQFVQIVEQVARVRPGLRALVIGDGPEREAIEHALIERNLGERVRVLGQRDDVIDWLRQCKVFVQPSQDEGLSIALAEAMSCGVPAVVADVGDLADLVDHSVNGWRVASGRTADYVSCILPLLGDGGLWYTFSQRATEAAQNLASLERVSARWSQLFSFWTTRTADRERVGNGRFTG